MKSLVRRIEMQERIAKPSKKLRIFSYPYMRKPETPEEWAIWHSKPWEWAVRCMEYDDSYVMVDV